MLIPVMESSFKIYLKNIFVLITFMFTEHKNLMGEENYIENINQATKQSVLKISKVVKQ